MYLSKLEESAQEISNERTHFERTPFQPEYLIRSIVAAYFRGRGGKVIIQFRMESG